MYEVQSDGTLRWRAGSAVTPVPRANTRVQTQSAGTGYFGAVSVPVSTGARWPFGSFRCWWVWALWHCCTPFWGKRFFSR